MGLEKQLGMRGWQYLEVLKYSIRNNPENAGIIVPPNASDSTREALIHAQGMNMFRQLKKDYDEAVRKRKERERLERERKAIEK